MHICNEQTVGLITQFKQNARLYWLVTVFSKSHDAYKDTKRGLGLGLELDISMCYSV